MCSFALINNDESCDSCTYCCLQELEAIRDALTPTLACAAAKIGDVEALEAIKEMVRLSPDSPSWYQRDHL